VERAKRAEAAVQAKWDALKAADGAGAIAAVGTTTASSSASRTLTMASDDSGSGAASSSLQHRRLRLESGASYSDPSAVAACDGVHMTAFGHRLVAALLLQLVGEAIAIGPAAEQKSSLRPPKGAAQIPEALIASTPPLFNTLSELAEFSPVSHKNALRESTWTVYFFLYLCSLEVTQQLLTFGGKSGNSAGRSSSSRGGCFCPLCCPWCHCQADVAISSGKIPATMKQIILFSISHI